MASVDIQGNIGIGIASGKAAAPFTAAVGCFSDYFGSQAGFPLKIHIGLQDGIHHASGVCNHRLGKNPGYIVIELRSGQPIEDSVNFILVYRYGLGFQPDACRLVEGFLQLLRYITDHCMIFLQQRADNTVCNIPVHLTVGQILSGQGGKGIGQGTAHSLGILSGLLIPSLAGLQEVQKLRSPGII